MLTDQGTTELLAGEFQLSTVQKELQLTFYFSLFINIYLISKREKKKKE